MNPENAIAQAADEKMALIIQQQFGTMTNQCFSVAYEKACTRLVTIGLVLLS